MIDITIPTGRAPDVLVNEALCDVFDRVDDTRADPPQLLAAMGNVRTAIRHEDPVALDEALRTSAAAHVAALTRLRATCPDLGGS